MKIIVVGATGTIGKEVVRALSGRHEVVGVSRKSEGVSVDIGEPASIKAMYEKIGPVDAVVSTAGSAAFKPLTNLSDEDFALSLSNKLMGQVNLVRLGIPFVTGSFTLTSGILAAEPMHGSAAVSLVNAGLEGFVRAAALELSPVRVNVVSPPWIRETLIALGMDSEGGMPASEVAGAYAEAVEDPRVTAEVIDARKARVIGE